MGIFNLTRPSEFILLGLFSSPEDQKPLLALFLIMYLVTLMGNLVIILAIHSNFQVQNPMYFFLSILSFADICYTTVIVPKMLVNLSETKTISYAECLAQMYFFLVFGNTDSYLLATTAIDIYVALCNPFHYVTVMNHRCCVLLVTFSIAFSYLHSLLHVLLVNRLNFCASNVIHHFFCDVNPLLKLSCSSNSVNEVVARTEGLVSVMAPFVYIISYVQILNAVIKIPSTTGKRKAFSSCSSHLSLMTLFYGSISYVYLQPPTSCTIKNQIATIIYTVLTPILNPFMYSLRNKDMKHGSMRFKPQTSLTRVELAHAQC